MWFAEIDWGALYRKEIPAPYVPNVRMDTNASQYVLRRARPWLTRQVREVPRKRPLRIRAARRAQRVPRSSSRLLSRADRSQRARPGGRGARSWLGQPVQSLVIVR